MPRFNLPGKPPPGRGSGLGGTHVFLTFRTHFQRRKPIAPTLPLLIATLFEQPFLERGHPFSHLEVSWVLPPGHLAIPPQVLFPAFESGARFHLEERSARQSVNGVIREVRFIGFRRIFSEALQHQFGAGDPSRPTDGQRDLGAVSKPSMTPTRIDSARDTQRW